VHSDFDEHFGDLALIESRSFREAVSEDLSVWFFVQEASIGSLPFTRQLDSS
jgi:hypothetical protein